MLHLEEAHLDRITEAFHRILKGEAPPSIELSPDYPDDEYRQMVTYINRFVDEYKEFGRFVFALARGSLAEAPPKTRMQVAYSFKTLQASLRHLTWQTQQIAAGDFNQKVDFMGDFSEAFNRMTVQLKEAFEKIEEQNRQLAAHSRDLAGDLHRLDDENRQIKHSLRRLVFSDVTDLTDTVEPTRHDLNGIISVEQAVDED